MKGENERKGMVARTRQPGTMSMHVYCFVCTVLTSMASRELRAKRERLVHVVRESDRRAEPGGMNLYRVS